jgi:hypothetical protein
MCNGDIPIYTGHDCVYGSSMVFSIFLYLYIKTTLACIPDGSWLEIMTLERLETRDSVLRHIDIGADWKWHLNTFVDSTGVHLEIVLRS